MYLQFPLQNAILNTCPAARPRGCVRVLQARCRLFVLSRRRGLAQRTIDHRPRSPDILGPLRALHSTKWDKSSPFVRGELKRRQVDKSNLRLSFVAPLSFSFPGRRRETCSGGGPRPPGSEKHGPFHSFSLSFSFFFSLSRLRLLSGYLCGQFSVTLSSTIYNKQDSSRSVSIVSLAIYIRSSG